MSMSKEQEKFNRVVQETSAGTHQTFFNRPHWTRRSFFEVVGAGVTGAFLAERYAKAADVTSVRGRPPRTPRRTSSSSCWRARPATPIPSI